jgi:hypothetical protein
LNSRRRVNSAVRLLREAYRRRLNVSQETYRLKVVRLDSGELEVIGNRAGLKDLAGVCQGLSELSDDQAKTPANHYHIADYMNNAEDGSLELIIRYDPNL